MDTLDKILDTYHQEYEKEKQLLYNASNDDAMEHFKEKVEKYQRKTNSIDDDSR